MKLKPVLKGIAKWASLAVLFLILLGGVLLLIAYWRSTNDCGRLAAPSNPMKAITYCEYGVANVKLTDVEKPVPNDDQVLIKVRACSVNPYDWHFIEGTPKIMRLGVGLRKPKDTRLGGDVSGQIEAVGNNVRLFKPGDEVFGICSGAFAEYALAKKGLALKPANITFEQAAAVPVAGLTALQGLRDKGKVQPGEKVLINGASGGVGTFAVQIAKSFGAEVTGVCSTRNIELVRSLGADRVVDYTKEDFTKSDELYDVLLDNVANHSLSECRRVLNANGRYVMIGGGGANDQGVIGVMARPLQAMLLKPFVSQEMGMMMAQITRDDLMIMADLMQSGKVKPVIDRTYKLSQVPDAIRYLEEGHARGKVIVTLQPQATR